MTQPPDDYLPPTPAPRPPDQPPAYPPQQGGIPPIPPHGPAYTVPPQPRGGGSLALGVAISVVSIALVFGITLTSGDLNALAILFGWPVVLLIGGVVLAAIPKTSRTGGGILLGLGASILILGGVCFALIVTA